MTATMTPYRSEQQAGRDSFAQLLHAEWTKFRTVRGWVIGMTVAALAMILLGLFAAGTLSVACQRAGGPAVHGRGCVSPVPLGPAGEPVTDSFYLVGRPLAGNGSITVRITSLTGRYPGGQASSPGGQPAMTRGLQPWSKAGIIIAASPKPGSAYAAMLVTGRHGVRMQYDYTSDTAGLPGAVSTASPRWLRLTRSGQTVVGYDSADGVHWTRVGAATVPGLSSRVQAGLFVTSPLHADITTDFGGSSGSALPTVATGTFDRLALSGAWPAAAWTGRDVGGSGNYSDQLSNGGYHQAGGRFVVTGSGDIAPIPAGHENPGPPTVTTEQHLIGAFAALIGVAIIAAMFVTTEYRRGLVRLTLAASPRRGRVLAAKAIVAAAVTFVAGLAAGVIAVAAGTPLARSHGFVVYQVPVLTAVRVVAGTAALLAVAAVLAVAVGVILRRSAAAVAVVIVAIVLPYILAVASILPAAAGEWLTRLTPAAAFAVQQSVPAYPQVTAIYTPANGYFPLAPWAGFAVLCGYAALALGLAAMMLRRRDA